MRRWGAVAVLDLPLVVIDGAMPPGLCATRMVAATASRLMTDAPSRHHSLPELRAGTLWAAAPCALGAAAPPLDEGFPARRRDLGPPGQSWAGHDARETPVHSRGAS